MITVQFNKHIIDPRNTAGPPVSFTINSASIIIARSYAPNIRTLGNYENKVAINCSTFLKTHKTRRTIILLPACVGLYLILTFLLKQRTQNEDAKENIFTEEKENTSRMLDRIAK